MLCVEGSGNGIQVIFATTCFTTLFFVKNGEELLTDGILKSSSSEATVKAVY